MNVLRHKRFFCSAVYDEDFLRWDESGGSGGKNGRNLDESGRFGAKNGRNLDFSVELSWMQLYSRVKGIDFI